MKWVNDATGATRASSASSTSGGAPTPHAMNSVHHSGQLPHTIQWMTNLSDDSHTQYAHADGSGSRSAYIAERLNKSIFAGSGLSASSGILTSHVTLKLGVPSASLSVSSSNGVTGSSHTHAITTSCNTGVARAILATDSSGRLTIQHLGLGASPDVTLTILNATSPQFEIRNAASRMGKLGVDDEGTLTISTCTNSGAGNLTLTPQGDIQLNPTGNDVYPTTNYDLNLGLITNKFLTIHAAELWVETLVAASTMATIGGRILVAPTTYLTRNLDGDSSTSNGGFETFASGSFTGWTDIPSDGSVGVSPCSVAGVQSVVLVAGVASATRIYQNIDVSPCSQYYVRIWTRGDGTWAGRYNIWDYTNSATLLSGTTGISSCSWNLVELWFSTASTTNTVSITLLCPVSNTASAYFDNINFFESTIYTKHNSLNASDIAYMESNGRVEFMQVQTACGLISASGDYKYGVKRNLDATGWNDWYAGDAIANTGTSGNGFMDLYSMWGVNASATTVGPTIVGNVRASSTFNDWLPHWAIGNLNGLYGYSSCTYGAAFGKYATEQPFLSIDATNGIRIMYRDSASQSQTRAKWDIDGSVQIGRHAAGSGNVYITENGIHMRIGTDTRAIIKSEGDFLIGANASVAGSTSFAFFNIAQTYNSESVGAGDLLLGDNSASQANILWDKSAKRFIFRGGTASHLYLSSDGTLVAGSGNVTLSDNGIDLVTGTGSPNAIRWMSSGCQHTRIRNKFTGATATNILEIDSWFDTLINGYTGIVLTAGIGGTIDGPSRKGMLNIYADYSNDIYGVGISGGLSAGSAANPTIGLKDGDIFAASRVVIGQYGSACQTLGLTINQKAADDEIISLISTDINHGITDVTNTNTFSFLKKFNGAEGGVELGGLSASVVAVGIIGRQTVANSAKSTLAEAPILIQGALKSGTGTTSLTANSNLAVFRNLTATKAIVDADGDLLLDAAISASAYDDYDDVKLLTGLRASIMPEQASLRKDFSHWIEYARPVLQNAGIVHYNDNGHHFVSVKGLHMLTIDAIRQLYNRINSLEQIVIASGSGHLLLQTEQNL